MKGDLPKRCYKKYIQGEGPQDILIEGSSDRIQGCMTHEIKQKEESWRKKLGFEIINGGSISLHEGIHNSFEGSSFPRRRDSHEHSIINKLIERGGGVKIMKGEALELMWMDNNFEASTETTLIH